MANAFPIIDTTLNYDTKAHHLCSFSDIHLRALQKTSMRQLNTQIHHDTTCGEMNENEQASVSHYKYSNLGQKIIQSSKPYQVDEVITKQRALDVRVFRQFSFSVPQFLEEQSEKQTGVAIMTEKEALDRLMKGYDERGKWINHVSVHEPPVQYFASSSPSDVVVGAVDAQIRNLRSATRIPRKFCKDITKGDIKKEDQDFDETDNLPPHVYLSNMEVADEKQRKGIGSKLLDAVNNYVHTSPGVECIILSVYNDNAGAIALYEKYGFENLYKNSEYGTMIKVIR